MNRFFAFLILGFCLAFPSFIFAEEEATENAPTTVIGSQICTEGCLYTGPNATCQNKEGEVFVCSGCAFCGDGNKQVNTYCNPAEPIELCDDGTLNSDDANHCRETCVIPYCGDGILDDDNEFVSVGGYTVVPHEVCDDGVHNSLRPNECRPDCTEPKCGDNVTDNLAPYNETCDGSSACRSPGADAECTYCGDGEVQEDATPSEQCDNGTVNNSDSNTDACRSSCNNYFCGDGIKDSNEKCDTTDFGTANGVQPSNPAGKTCRMTGNDKCTYCGDGVRNADEICDDGNNVDTDACRNNCTGAICGDNIRQTSLGETCDGTDTPVGETCRASGVSGQCTYCGDGVRNGDEGCDDGNNVDTDTCRNNCTTSICGDNIRQTSRGETCDGTDTPAGRTCRAPNASSPCTYCGDGSRNGGEACDDGNTNNNDSCRNDCTVTCVPDACGRPCGHANYGQACTVVCGGFPNCNNAPVPSGNGQSECYKKNPGNCSAAVLDAWCTRNKNDKWDDLHWDWVDTRCNGRINTGSSGKQEVYSCYDSNTLTTYSCKTPLVMIFDLESAVQYTADDEKSEFNLSAKGEEASTRTDWPTAVTPWLALDRDGDGQITSGQELFGSATEIGGKSAAHGFEALAALDDNKDGKIDSNDPAYDKLVLWGDKNADRVSDKSELQTLKDRGVSSIGLDYTIAQKCDERGNCERERANFTWIGTDGKEHQGVIVDIYLVSREKRKKAKTSK